VTSIAASPAARAGAGRTRYRLPQLTMARFVGVRTMRTGAVWGLVFGLYVYDNAYAFDTIARNGALRHQLLTTMASNAGLKALLGDTRGITSRGGFTDWRAIGVTALVASIWGLLAATRTLRGEESAGRWELFLAAATTQRRAAAGALAGLGAGVLADKDTAAPRTAMLGSPTLFALRMSRAVIISWLLATVVAALLYGSLAKSTGQAFASSGALRKFTRDLTHVALQQLQLAGTRVFAGIIFLILMALIMAYVASAVGKVREDEAEGYVDNLVVRSISRQRWLSGRVGLTLAVLLAAGVLGGVSFWVAAASQHAGLTFSELLLAGINSAAPAALLLGIGVLTLGLVPRLTSIVCWGLLAWAFLLDMLGSAIKVNHWLMDTSLLYHVALAPAVSPDWRIAGTYLAIGGTAALLGGWRFTRRDLQSS